MIDRDSTPTAAVPGRSDAESFVLTREHSGASEYDVFRRAYVAWYGREADDRRIDALFGKFLRSDELPMFVRHYVRRYVEDHSEDVREIVKRERRAWRLDRIMLAVVAVLVMFALWWGMQR